MKDQIRRKLLVNGTAILGGGALAASLSSASATDKESSKNIFELPQSVIPIYGSVKTFPVRRIYCIGRNYAAHALERGADPTKEPPFFFQKPADAIQVAGASDLLVHNYPTLTNNYHYEVELVAALSKGGINISVEDALQCVFGYAVGIDMTRRDLQNAASAAKHPWEVGKSFDHSAIIGPLHSVKEVGHLSQGAIWLKLNGEVKQSSNLSKMIWSVAQQISQLSQANELKPGDIIFSGTPENVGPVKSGDVMKVHIDNLDEFSVLVK